MLIRRIRPFLLLLIGIVTFAQSFLSIAATGAKNSAGTVELLTLHSTIFSNTRTIRVWLPPEYHRPDSAHRQYPVFYFTDGVATFHGRELGKIAAKLTASGNIQLTIFVGIDNGGSTRESKHPGSDRANEYLPFPDEFLDPPVPNPHGKLFPSFFQKEVRPLVESHYRTSGEIGIAGSSYGGTVALYTALQNPRQFRWLLLESPSLYVDHDKLLSLSEAQQQWPPYVYVGAGTDEGEGDAKKEMVDDVNRLASAIHNKSNVCKVIVPGAEHSEDAWRLRLPSALKFLLGNHSCSAPIAP